ncbi:MAG: hypothetical protein IJR14_00025 [Synergistaceae bacterium]|nr:hypothetical protein [Synergistaceae bacterium]
MPSRKVYDIAVRTGSYTTRDGEERGRWDNVGAVFVHEGRDGDRPYILLKRTFNPAGLEAREGSDTVLLSLFKPKPREERQGHGGYSEERREPRAEERSDAGQGRKGEWDPYSKSYGDEAGNEAGIPF